MVLFINFFVASVAALATASSHVGSRHFGRHEDRRPKSFDGAEIPSESVPDVAANSEYSENWAGAVVKGSNGTFTTVTGTFVVPTPSGSDGSASAWVGIDGYECGNAILQTGVNIIIYGGLVSYYAWYEWYPDYADSLPIDIGIGDEIKTTVTAYSTNYGVAVIENLSNGQAVAKAVSSPYSLCEATAEWIVEDYQDGDGNYVTFVNFSTVTFTSATASGSGCATYTPSSHASTILDMHRKNQTLAQTSVSTSGLGDTVTVSYV